MGVVIYMADFRSTPSERDPPPAGFSIHVPARPARSHNGWEECDYCLHADGTICSLCEDAELFQEDEEAIAKKKEPATA